MRTILVIVNVTDNSEVFNTGLLGLLQNMNHRMSLIFIYEWHLLFLTYFWAVHKNHFDR